MNEQRGLGAAIAFSVLVACATHLEANGYPCRGLWLLIVIWALIGKF